MGCEEWELIWTSVGMVAQHTDDTRYSEDSMMNDRSLERKHGEG